ncbi:MAG: hypothetical protein J6V91_00770, partial [Kiritimatiellae bacterium]|nr:hypothetical protein [Kiritimatiellia bacterium]
IQAGSPARSALFEYFVYFVVSPSTLAVLFLCPSVSSVVSKIHAGSPAAQPLTQTPELKCA